MVTNILWLIFDEKMQGSGLLIDNEVVKEKSVEELNAQLVSIVGENGAEMLISAFRSRRSISVPELTG